MKRWFAAFVLGTVISGCGPEAAPPAPTAIKVEATPQREFPDADFARTSPLAILADGNKRLKVGDKATAFDAAFPKPSKANSLRDVPQGFPSSYMVRGWERDNGTEGAGALVQDGRIAVAMHQIAGADETELTAILHRYEADFGAGSVVSGARVRYWFWESSPHRLMISAYETGGPRRAVTIALGDQAVLAEIGVSPELANKDRETLQRLLTPTPAPSLDVK